MGTFAQVSFGLMAEIDFMNGEFDFEFMGDPLEAGEFEAILQSLIEFDLSLILDAFEFFLDGLEELLNYLAEAPRENGRWREKHWTGTGFPRVFMLKYHGYAAYFPLWALARYRNLMRGNSRTVLHGM